MKVALVVVGRVRGALAGAVEEYEARARRYWKLDVIEVEAGASGRSPDAKRVTKAEGERILQRLPPGFDVVALTREGRPMGSHALARYLQDLALQSRAGVAFVIGGAFGLDDDVLRQASHRLTLSAMTMPHEMARLVLAEQLYRAGTITRNEPYHKGVR
jgi:23S rRNA (pseudouridine1915-N3)-methyltransferase